ncbi:myosin II heavy chain [Abortiporus biennis]|nr:myosin II heavy chain [Abortiporus biennis]
MPPPRPSQSAEAARAAALQAEFNEKKWVWVPDDKEGYLAGWVVKEEDDMGEVVMAAGGEIRRLPLYALSKMNPPKFDRVDDIADLTFLNEASVVHNLRLRYGSGAIYTYSGLFLVAINPYQSLPLYSDAIVHQYRGKRRDENPPHIFAIAERAWINMGEERENQSILITGESGAGKTESTKKVIQYLAAIATDTHPPNTPTHSQSPSLAARLGLLERQILQANPILEAFGNAQTQRNNNSSRFGKFIRISFAPDGSIAGANIDWYLLEKSRVVVRSEAERSFHVFYQLMEAGGSLKETLLLDGNVEDYEYLNKSRREVDGIDDVEEWHSLKSALEIVGFTSAEQLDLFRVVAAVLHIGNITIASTRSDDAVMPDPSQAERVCHLLGIPVSEFTRAVLRPRVLAGREWITQARTRQQAMDELGALCKTLYEKSFGMLVDRINRALDRPSSKSTFIGVLDIAGFEIFETNGYEQLLINYTNEKLQQFFNHHMFVLEQEEYAREGIEWDYVNFGLDLQPTIDLIETSGNAIGILSLLDEECIMPKATDLTFTQKLHGLWASDVAAGEEENQHPGKMKYEPARFDQGFLIQHYAGRVEYRTDGWLDKNKDPLNDNLTRVLASSSEKYVASLFSDFAEPSVVSSHVNAFSSATLTKKRGTKKGAFRTVGQRHKEQLSSLMTQLQATQPHFVRCIVPNTLKKPGRVDVPLVLDQLRCNGVLEGIRIARLGYPNRLPFVEFRQRYEVLTPGVIPRGYMDGRKACLRMVDALELDKSIFRIGTSKIFFKAGVLAELEERRDALLYDVFSRLQAVCRMWSARRQMKKILNRAVAIRTVQRNARVYAELRDWPWWQLYTKVRPMLAATRSDDELRRKEAELALIKERAERDKQEREALESLKMRLESEKRRVEEALESERALTVDKDALLERSKKREGELEEEVAALQTDLDTLDSQLDRALKLQKESEEKHETLRQAFDQAAEHLVRLETEQQEWIEKESKLTSQLNEAEEDIDILEAEKEELQKVVEELKNLVVQREEDVTRAKERMDNAVSELDSKLTTEVRSRDALKSKAETLEQDARQAKEQLAELARTATDYSNMIKKKEDDMDRLTSELTTSKQERARLMKQISELQGKIDSLTSELQSQRSERQRDATVQSKLQAELDELRSLLDAKANEETRRSEADKSKEEELGLLRSQVNSFSQELSEAKKSAVEGQSKLKVELESLVREHHSLQQSHKSLSDRERTAQSQLKKVEASLAEAEKTKRSLESELNSTRSRQIDVDGQLAEALKEKEANIFSITLERKLLAAQAKYQDFEDVVLQLERDKSAQDRQLETSRQQLDNEVKKRTQAEKMVSSQKAEIIRIKDLNVKLDRELNKALTDLKNREWEVKQLESKQDKTIVEHVHVLEEAKRVTDNQLKEAQKELAKQDAYIRSLEKSKSGLAREAEDIARERDREQLELRNKAKAIRAQEEKVRSALQDAENERRAREAAELHVRRLQGEVEIARTQVADVTQQLATTQKAKDNLELELTKLADDADGSTSLAKIQRQYESRIGQLENQLEEALMAKETAARIKEHVDRQHQEIRRLIMSGPKDEAFRSRLLRELQLADEEMEREFLSRTAKQVRISTGGPEIRTLANTRAMARNSHWHNTALVYPRRILFAQQRASNVELEDQRRQVQELSQSKKDLQAELADLKDRLEVELLAKNEESAAKRQLQVRLQELEISTASTATIHKELQEAIETYKTKTDSYIRKLELAEIAAAKASRAEQFARRALEDTERARDQATAEKKESDERLKAAEARVHDLETKLEEEGRESSDLDLLRQRLTEEMEDERKQYQQDLADRDFAADQTRKKYQTELAQLSEVYSGGAWKKEKERLETKIQDLTKAYESSSAAQTEQQSQIVSLHSQVRELRSVLNDAEADRALLQKARRALQAELESIKLDHVDTNKMTSDTELQNLRLKKQDLERALEEQGDRVSMAYERMKKAEGYANECQVELGKVRVENSELEKLNVSNFIQSSLK